MNNLNLDKYKNDGFGLSKLTFQYLINIIKKNDRIIEFGSGISTYFLHDLDNTLDNTLDITSFENEISLGYQIKDNDNIKLHIRELVECDDESYNKMFKQKEYDSLLMKPKTSELHTRQKNNFYDIKDGDIFGLYDVFILDGPNGNGRNFSFLHLKNHMKSGGHVIIDDYNHYDFVDKFLSIFDADLIFKINDRGNWVPGGNWERKGQFAIYKIK